MESDHVSDRSLNHRSFSTVHHLDHSTARGTHQPLQDSRASMARSDDDNNGVVGGGVKRTMSGTVLPAGATNDTIEDGVAAAADEVVCKACGFESSFVPEGMLPCKKCETVQYCSRHCLEWDWTSGGHKSVCPGGAGAGTASIAIVTAATSIHEENSLDGDATQASIDVDNIFDNGSVTSKDFQKSNPPDSPSQDERRCTAIVEDVEEEAVLLENDMKDSAHLSKASSSVVSRKSEASKGSANSQNSSTKKGGRSSAVGAPSGKLGSYLASQSPEQKGSEERAGLRNIFAMSVEDDEDDDEGNASDFREGATIRDISSTEDDFFDDESMGFSQLNESSSHLNTVAEESGTVSQGFVAEASWRRKENFVLRTKSSGARSNASSQLVMQDSEIIGTTHESSCVNEASTTFVAQEDDDHVYGVQDGDGSCYDSMSANVDAHEQSGLIDLVDDASCVSHDPHENSTLLDMDYSDGSQPSRMLLEASSESSADYEPLNTIPYPPTVPRDMDPHGSMTFGGIDQPDVVESSASNSEYNHDVDIENGSTSSSDDSDASYDMGHEPPTLEVPKADRRPSLKSFRQVYNEGSFSSGSSNSDLSRTASLKDFREVYNAEQDDKTVYSFHSDGSPGEGSMQLNAHFAAMTKSDTTRYQSVPRSVNEQSENNISILSPNSTTKEQIARERRTALETPSRNIPDKISEESSVSTGSKTLQSVRERNESLKNELNSALKVYQEMYGEDAAKVVFDKLTASTDNVETSRRESQTRREETVEWKRSKDLPQNEILDDELSLNDAASEPQASVKPLSRMQKYWEKRAALPNEDTVESPKFQNDLYSESIAQVSVRSGETLDTDAEVSRFMQYRLSSHDLEATLIKSTPCKQDYEKPSSRFAKYRSNEEKSSEDIQARPAASVSHKESSSGKVDATSGSRFSKYRDTAKVRTTDVQATPVTSVSQKESSSGKVVAASGSQFSKYRAATKVTTSDFQATSVALVSTKESSAGKVAASGSRFSKYRDASEVTILDDQTTPAALVSNKESSAGKVPALGSRFSKYRDTVKGTTLEATSGAQSTPSETDLSTPVSRFSKYRVEANTTEAEPMARIVQPTDKSNALSSADKSQSRFQKYRSVTANTPKTEHIGVQEFEQKTKSTSIKVAPPKSGFLRYRVEEESRQTELSVADASVKNGFVTKSEKLSDSRFSRYRMSKDTLETNGVVAVPASDRSNPVPTDTITTSSARFSKYRTMASSQEQQLENVSAGAEANEKKRQTGSTSRFQKYRIGSANSAMEAFATEKYEEASSKDEGNLAPGLVDSAFSSVDISGVKDSQDDSRGSMSITLKENATSRFNKYRTSTVAQAESEPLLSTFTRTDPQNEQKSSFMKYRTVSKDPADDKQPLGFNDHTQEMETPNARHTNYRASLRPDDCDMELPPTPKSCASASTAGDSSPSVPCYMQDKKALANTDSTGKYAALDLATDESESRLSPSSISNSENDPVGCSSASAVGYMQYRNALSVSGTVSSNSRCGDDTSESCSTGAGSTISFKAIANESDSSSGVGALAATLPRYTQYRSSLRNVQEKSDEKQTSVSQPNKLNHDISFDNLEYVDDQPNHSDLVSGITIGPLKSDSSRELESDDFASIGAVIPPSTQSRRGKMDSGAQNVKMDIPSQTKLQAQRDLELIGLDESCSSAVNASEFLDIWNEVEGDTIKVQAELAAAKRPSQAENLQMDTSPVVQDINFRAPYGNPNITRTSDETFSDFEKGYGDVEEGLHHQPALVPLPKTKYESQESKIRAENHKRNRFVRCCIILSVMICLPLAIGLGIAAARARKRDKSDAQQILSPSLAPATIQVDGTLTVAPMPIGAPISTPIVRSTLAPQIMPTALPTKFLRTESPTQSPTTAQPTQSPQKTPPIQGPKTAQPTQSPQKTPPIQSPTRAPRPLIAPTPNPAAQPLIFLTGRPVAPVLSSDDSLASGAQADLFAMLVSVSYDSGASLLSFGSPQQLSFDWLTSDAELFDRYNKERILQRFALATLYYSTDGANWTDNTGWLSGEDECTWHSSSVAESCNGSGFYTSLNLERNNLAGILPRDLALLSSLEIIEMSSSFTGATLGGSLPAELGLLARLRVLNMHGNSFFGSIPATLVDLGNLERLDLSMNKLQNSVPTDVSGLSSLQTINLAMNQLSGSIPSSINRLTSLRKLSLGDNLLTGTVRIDGSLTLLTDLHLEMNKFTSVATEIGLLPSITSITLYENEIAGTMIPEWGNLSNLQTLDMHSNSISGLIPAVFQQMTELTHLNLARNELNGTIPATIGLHLQKLQVLQLQSNQFVGPLPDELGLLSSLKTIRIEGNNIDGEVQESICDPFTSLAPTFYLDCASSGDAPSGLSCPPGSCCTYCCTEGRDCQCLHAGTALQNLCTGD